MLVNRVETHGPPHVASQSAIRNLPRSTSNPTVIRQKTQQNPKRRTEETYYRNILNLITSPMHTVTYIQSAFRSALPSNNLPHQLSGQPFTSTTYHTSCQVNPSQQPPTTPAIRSTLPNNHRPNLLSGQPFPTTTDQICCQVNPSQQPQTKPPGPPFLSTTV